MKTKALSICLVVTFLILCLSSCAPSKEEVVGTYSGTYTYNGESYTNVIILKEDFTYVKASAKQSEDIRWELGTYEIKGKTIRLYKDGDTGSWTQYEYSKGVLENNNHKFYKK